MKLRLFFILLILVCAGGCVAVKKNKAISAQAPVLLSLPEAREKVVSYYESGQFDEAAAKKAALVVEAVNSALRNGVKFPAVVISVEDVLLSTYPARKKQGFSSNAEAKKDLESRVILSVLPPIKSSLELFQFLTDLRVPVFLVSHRPEGLRLPVMENLAKVGFSGWKKMFMLPHKYPENLNYNVEIRKSLKESGFNVVATVSAVPDDLIGDFSGIKVLYPNYIYSERE